MILYQLRDGIQPGTEMKETSRKKEKKTMNNPTVPSTLLYKLDEGN